VALVQRSFEELGTPLSEVTFCVLDLETTGGSPVDCSITEVGACKVRMGEVQGTFQTLVNPGCPVPAFIRLLTGIGEEMLVEAPPIETVLPSLLEFVSGTVLVAHNARFDVGFVNAALTRWGHEPLANRVLDTAALARKVLAGEVRDHKLETLARYLRCAHRPTHRAFEDVLATVDVLHHIIERATGYGVTTLEDLIAISSAKLDGTFKKIGLTDNLPRAIGIYRFIGRGGRTLYVGKATDVRARVRSYFYSDPRRKVRDLLRQTEKIETEVHATMLEAEIAEARAIAAELPSHNRAGKRVANWYVKASPVGGGRVAAARSTRDDSAVYIGPFSLRRVKTIIDTLRDARPIHRCSTPARCTGCAFSEMGRCAGGSPEQHVYEVQQIAAALNGDLEGLLEPLDARMRVLAAQERFEEAAELRTRAAGLAATISSHAQIKALVEAGRVLLAIRERALLIERGRLVWAGHVDRVPARAEALFSTPARTRYLTAEMKREATLICSWLARTREPVRILDASGPWAIPLSAQPTTRFAIRADAV
jgi:DNA polymerase-3 subunit epsilon